MCKFKVEILLDEDKIREVGEYKPESIYKAIRESFAGFDLPELPTEDGTLVFCDKGRNRDFGALGSIAVDLYDANWFRPYVKKFLWYNNEAGSVEDIVKECRDFDEKFN